MFDEDGGTNVEQVGLGCEVVDPIRGDNALAQLAKRHQHR